MCSNSLSPTFGPPRDTRKDGQLQFLQQKFVSPGPLTVLEVRARAWMLLRRHEQVTEGFDGTRHYHLALVIADNCDPVRYRHRIKSENIFSLEAECGV